MDNQVSETRRNSKEKLKCLYLLSISNRGDEALQEQFARCCVQVLKSEVARNIYRKGLCPSFLSRTTFAEDALSLALQKFWAGLSRVEAPQKFAIWLAVVAHSAVVEELRLWTRRTKDGANRWEPLEWDNSEEQQ